MLVTFHSSTSGEIVMFAESARTVLGVLGKECSARGVITLEQLPDEIALLRAAIDRDKTAQAAQASAVADPPAGTDGAGKELPVGFVQRATPFIEMLERTLDRKGYVTWQAAADFGA